MFPIPFNFPFRKKDGSITTINDAIEGGGTPYELPTASATVKGGVKIGANLSMDGDTLNASGGGGEIDPTTMEYTVGVIGDYEYYSVLNKTYIGSDPVGYEFLTASTSGGAASIEIYKIHYSNGAAVRDRLLDTLIHNAHNTFSDVVISVIYSSSKWIVSFTDTLYKTDGTTWTSPIEWVYSETVDNIALLTN